MDTCPPAVTLNDGAAAAIDLGQLLLSRGETIAVSEATTGGFTNALLQAVPNASRFSVGAITVYSGTAAKALLPEAVTRALFIKGYTSSSSVYRASKVQWVTEMARHVRERFGADWGIAESGAVTQIGGRLAAAGAFTALAVCGPDGTVVTRLFDSPTPRDRLGNMLRYSTAQLQFLKEVIEDGGGADRVKARL